MVERGNDGARMDGVREREIECTSDPLAMMIIKSREGASVARALFSLPFSQECSI